MSLTDIQFTVYHKRSALLKLSYFLLAIGAAFFLCVHFDLIELRGEGHVVLPAIILVSSIGLLRGYSQEKPFLMLSERTLIIQTGIGFHYQAIPKGSIELIKLVKHRGAADYIGVFLRQGSRHVLDRTYWVQLWM
mgnify:CR=1 FL=1